MSPGLIIFDYKFTLSVKNMWALYLLTIDKTTKSFLESTHKFIVRINNVYMNGRVTSRSAAGALLQRKTSVRNYSS